MALLVGAPAARGAGIDAHRAAIPAHDGVTGGLVDDVPDTRSSEAVVGAHVGLEGQPAVRSTGDAEPELVVGDALTTRFQAVAFPLEPLGLTAHVPVRLAAGSDVGAGGPAFGDARVRAWWRPLKGSLTAGLGLGAWLPSGSQARTAGTGRVVPGAVGSMALRRGPVRVHGAGGLELEGAPEPAAALGGAVLRGGVGAHLVSSVGTAGLSVAGARPLNAEILARRGGTAELMADGSLFLGNRTSLVGSAALAPAGGVGPAWRVGTGVTVRLGGPDKPQAVVVRQVQVVDPDGRPVAAARVASAAGTLVADARGLLEVDTGLAGTVSAKGLGDAPLRRDATEVVLPWGTVPLRVDVVAADGTPIEPAVSLVGPDGEVTVDGGAAALGPGTWTLAVSAEGYGGQERSITVPPRAVEPIDVEVALLPRRGDARLDLSLTDLEGDDVRGAEVRVDGVSVGTSAGERVGVDGLADGDVVVEVGRHAFREQSVDVTLDAAEAAELDLILGYAPGTVRLTAEGPGGPLTDAMLFVDGPQALPPLALGDEGRTLLTLAPGQWTLALSSPAHGLQERLLVVDGDSPVPIDVAFVLMPEERGNAELWVHVRDVAGDAVEGAEVRVDGELVGQTSTGGQLRLGELQPRTLTVAVTGAGVIPESRDVSLQPGVHRADMVVAWEAGTLQVSARDPEGPVDALVAFDGPEAYDGGPLGPPGRRTFVAMPAGAWEVLASHEAGMEVAWTLVSDEPGRRATVDMRLGEEGGAGVLDLTVTDPDGAPVGDALVSLDGEPLVRTADGGRVRVRGLAEGSRQVTVSHPHFVESSARLGVSQQARERSMELRWAPGLLDVRATAAGVPVRDGMLYASPANPDAADPILPQPLDATGQARVVVPPGRWELVVSSVEGLVGREVDVPADAQAPQVVSIDVTPREGVLVHVVNQRGEPAEGVALVAGEEMIGTTDSAGLAVVQLADAPVTVSLHHPNLLPAPDLVLATDDEERWVEVAWAPRGVAVALRHDGEPVAGQVRAIGPQLIDPVAIDGDGKLFLEPGSWELVVDPGEALGAMRKGLVVPPGADDMAIQFDLTPPRVRATETGLEVTEVLFEVGDATPTSAYADILEELAARVVSDPSVRLLQVQGHTDTTGDLAYNYELSRRRAEAVVATLVANGVPPVLLRAKGYGPSRPTADNETEEGRSLNRRVDFLITLDEGRDEGG